MEEIMNKHQQYTTTNWRVTSTQNNYMCPSNVNDPDYSTVKINSDNEESSGDKLSHRAGVCYGVREMQPLIPYEANATIGHKNIYWTRHKLGDPQGTVQEIKIWPRWQMV